MTNIMLDLETYATSTNAAIVSVAACVFIMDTGEIKDTFHQNINLYSNVALGRDVSEETLSWWSNQSESAQAGLTLPSPEDFEVVLHNFNAWVLSHSRDPYVWGNGVLFDNAIIRSAFAQCNIRCPWSFRNDRDVRTLVAVGKAWAENKKDNASRAGLTHHHALHDCIYQVRYVSAIYNRLAKRAS